MLALYIIPGNIPHTKIFIPLMLGVLGLQVLSQKVVLSKIDFLLIVLISSLAMLFNFNTVRLADAIYASILLVVCRKQQEVDRKYILFFYFFSLIAIVFQLSVYRFDGSPVLHTGRPNSSGVYMLLFFFFCFKNNLKIGVLVSIISSFFFLSRGYIFSLVIFFTLWILEIFVSKYISSWKKNFLKLYNQFKNYLSFFNLILILNLALIGFGFYFVNHVNIVYSNGRIQEFSRIFQLQDSSNFKRFAANDILIQNLLENPKFLLFGISGRGSDELLQFIDSETTAHNSFLIIVATRGIIFAIVYFIIISIVIKRIGLQNNLKYLLSLCFFSLVLHSIFQGATLVLFITTLSLPESMRRINVVWNYKTVAKI